MIRYFLITSAVLIGLSLQSSLFINSIETCIKNRTCVENILKQYSSSPSKKELCELCAISIPVVKELIKKNDTKSFRDIATAVCTILNITQETICYQAVGLFEV